MSDTAQSSLLDDYFTEEELAAELRVTARTLRNWRRDKIGPPATPIGQKMYYFKPSAVKWMRKREQSEAA